MTTARLWIAITALVLVCTSVHAQSTASIKAAPPKIAVDIEAQPIRGALQAFGKQTGVQVLFRSEDTAIGDVMTPRVSGVLSAQEALERLLAKTGLKYEFVNEHTVRISSVRPVSGVKGTEELLSPNGIPDPAPEQNEGQSRSNTDISRRQEAEEPKLQEIIVSARKRTENLQNVPASVQVVGGQTLAEQNYNTLQSVTEMVPAVHIDNTAGEANNLYIRGIGSGEDRGLDQSVAMFNDDIYHGRSLMTGATFLDLERIEILKGPQSTFFGNNAIAGALNMVTKKPGDSFDASGRLLYGQFDTYAAEGAVGGPITDTWSVRVAAARNGQSGWIENINTRKHEPDINNEAARLTLRFTPNESLDALLKVEGSKNRTSGSASQWDICPPPAPFTASFSGGCAQALALGLPIGLNQDKSTGIAGQGDSLSTTEDVLTINFHRWNHTFTSVSGFYSFDNLANADAFQVPTPLFTLFNSERFSQLSQEFRVASPTGGPVEYMAGVYFQADHRFTDKEANFPELTPVIQSIPPFAPLVPYLPYGLALPLWQSEHVYSVFGSLSWNATDRLKLNAGLRGSWVKKENSEVRDYGTATQTYGGVTPFPAVLQNLAGSLLGEPPAKETFSTSDQAWMPSAGVQYQLAEQAMAYFTYSRGFKAGGVVSNFAAATEFGPEHVDAYELGVKSKWLDNRLLVNLDVFLSNYHELQVQSLVYVPAVQSYGQIIRNAAESRSQGVELETQWVLSESLHISANVTYLESYYVRYPNGPLTSLQGFCAVSYVLPYCSIFPNPVPAFSDLSNQSTPFSPRWSGSVVVNYGVHLPSDYRLTAQLIPYFTSSYNKDPQLDALGIGYFAGTSAYVRLDGTLTLATPDSRWAVDVIGKNLTDRTITSAGTITTKEEPRSVAVQVRYKY